MIDNQNERLKEYYDSLLDFPKQVEEIFSDFYGEDRVELQGYPSSEDFIDFLTNTALGSYVTHDSVYYSPNNTGTEDAHNRGELFNNNRTHPITHSEEVFSELSPVIIEKIERKLFDELCIIVHFPHVRITNEYDRYVDVNNLWAKVPVKVSGKGYGWFGLNRSEYQFSHMQADYMHSHVSGINWNDFTHFPTPCTGTGPINNTMSSLAIDFDAPLWQLFCLELERYVATESLAGGPYRRMERIDSNNRSNSYTTWMMSAPRSYDFLKATWKDFIKYILKSKKIKFNYINGSYGVAYSYIEWNILISNLFIEWYNLRYTEGNVSYTLEYLLDNSILINAVLGTNSIHYGNRGTVRDVMRYAGRHILYFKGNAITLTIVNEGIVANNEVTLLEPRMSEEILKVLLETLNYKYGNSEETSTGTGKTNTRYV